MGWLPDGFHHPEWAELVTGHHMRPIRASDVKIDYSAVMGSRVRLWQRYGEAWGWPPATMTLEQDRADLAHHEAEMTRGEAFNYAVLDEDESELLGCVYIDPPPAATRPGRPPAAPRPGVPPAATRPGADAVVSWWVVDHAVGTELERALAEFVPRWLRDTWHFKSVEFAP